MRISLAHLRERSAAGGWIDFAVFGAKSTTGSNAELLESLTLRARQSGLKVDQAALAFMEGGRVQFYGSRPLVDFLSRNGVPAWTHEIDA
jgi:hypothetical protein